MSEDFKLLVTKKSDFEDTQFSLTAKKHLQSL